MIRYTYLLINLLSVLVPFAASFHSASRLYKRWYALLPAIAVTAISYCIWDAWFTKMGIWGFNPQYLLGTYWWNLPLEEVLFFICIPYACIFTFDSAAKLLPAEEPTNTLRIFNYFLVFAFAVVAIIYHTKYYTCSAFAIPSVAILIAELKKVTWLKRFYIVYAILMLPFMIVNGLLTGTALTAPVVWYNPSEIIGPRILTIPIEDIFYGMGLVLINVGLYQQWLKLNIK